MTISYDEYLGAFRAVYQPPMVWKYNTDYEILISRASVNCTVEYMNPRGSSTQKYVRVMQVSSVPTATDNTSEIIYAELVLSGRLIPATVSTIFHVAFLLISTYFLRSTLSITTYIRVALCQSKRTMTFENREC